MMPSEQPDRPDTMQNSFFQIVDDLRYYLRGHQKRGITRICINAESEQLLSQWEKGRQKEPVIRFEGPLTARIMIVDSEGTFYSGESGRLLQKILKAMHLTPDRVMICEAAGFKEIQKMIGRVSPKAVIAMGDAAIHSLLQTGQGSRRHRFHPFGNTQVMPTFHPSQLLVQPQLKRQVWEDMKQVMAVAGLGAHGT